MLDCPLSISNFTQDYCIGNHLVYSNHNLPFGLTTTSLLLLGIGLIIIWGLTIEKVMFKEKQKLGEIK